MFPSSEPLRGLSAAFRVIKLFLACRVSANGETENRIRTIESLLSKNEGSSLSCVTKAFEQFRWKTT